MKYMGSKNRHAKELLPIILKDRREGQCYVEPFVGGANMIDKVDGWRIGSDSHEFQISLLKKLSSGWLPPEIITENEYSDIKKNIDSYPPELVGYAGFQLTYGAKWLDSYRRDSIGKRCYSSEAYRNVAKQANMLAGIEFEVCSYDEISLPSQSIIYCDPPYQSSTGYRDKFDHKEFWNWCRDMSSKGHDVFISEYNAPDDFVCIWEKKVNSSLTKNTGGKQNIERLFRHKSQANHSIDTGKSK